MTNRYSSNNSFICSHKVWFFSLQNAINLGLNKLPQTGGNFLLSQYSKSVVCVCVCNQSWALAVIFKFLYIEKRFLGVFHKVNLIGAGLFNPLIPDAH